MARGGRKPKLTPAQLREARVLVGQTSMSHAARKFGLSPTGLRMALQRAETQEAAEPPEVEASETGPVAGPKQGPPSEPGGATGGDGDESDELPLDEAMTVEEQKAWLTEVMADARKQSRLMFERDQSSEARKTLELAFKAANTLARLSANDSDDDLRLPRDQVARIAQDAKAKLMAAANRPLLCAHCSRELSMAWGRGDSGTTKEAEES